MNKKGILVKDARILILGFTFKEDCPDIRNTKVADIYTTLHEYTDRITVWDPYADAAAVKRAYGIDIVNEKPREKFDALVMAVAHDEFLHVDFALLAAEHHFIYDVKSILPKDVVDGRL